jgi:hypothetical protein
MTRIDFDALRLRCQFAFEAYKSRAASVLEHSKHGEIPPTAELHAEEVALYEYAKVRREMLDALSTVHRASRDQTR